MVYVVRLSISTSIGLVHSRVILRLDHTAQLEFSLDINSIHGFVRSSSHTSVILKIAISQVEPNLFFRLLSILISSYLSHSKYKTVSTKCSKVLGQAKFQSFVTCHIITTVVLVDLPKSTIASAISFT